MPAASFFLFGTPYALNPPAAMLLAAVAMTLGLAWHGGRMRRFPGRDRFVVMQVGAAVWALAATMENMAQTPDAKLFWAEMAWGGIVAAPTAWAMFVWSYGHGAERLVPGRWVWLPALMPAVAWGMALTNDLHGLMYRAAVPVSAEPGAPLDYHHGLFYFLVIVYLYGFMLFSVIAIVDAVHRSHGLYRRHYLGMAVAMMMPWAANLGYVSGTFTLFDFDPTPFSFLLMSAIFHWLIARRHLFELLPIARSALLDSLPDPVLIVDGAGMVVEVNQAASELVRAPSPTGVAFSSLPVLGEQLAPLLAGNDSAAAEMELTADHRHFEVRRVGLERDGHTVGTMLMLRDVTHRRAAEEQLRATLADLRRAKADAEAVSHAKSEFLAVMSHEIRTPMNGVTAMAELLAQTRVDGEQQSMLSILRQSADGMMTIIDDILDFSRIEAGRLTLEQVAFDPVRVAEDVAQMVAPRAYEKGLEVVVDPAPALPAQVLGDPARLRQVLLNLAGNAVKFTERGHVRVAIQPDGDGAIRFAVSDSGIGIAPDLHSRLFQPFTQADGSVARRYGGTGLGLSICRRLLDLMGGRIWLDSRPGAGSTFFFTLPSPAVEAPPPPTPAPLAGLRIRVEAPEPLGAALSRQLAARGATLTPGRDAEVVVRDGPLAPGETAPGAPATVTLVPFHHLDSGTADGLSVRKPVRGDDLAHAVAIAAGRETVPPAPLRSGGHHYAAPSDAVADAEGIRLLVAEDSVVNRMVLSKMLDRLGVAYDLAPDGRTALERFRARPYGMVLTDFHMPDMDGVTLARALRREGASVPIVALTADVLAQTAGLCADAGMQGYLTKPLSLTRLEETLAQHLPRALELRRPLAADGAGTAAVPGRPLPPVFDSAPLVEIFGALGDEALALLADFAANTESHLNALREAMAEDDRELARHHAHTARGSARSVGAAALAESFGAIDDSLADGDTALAERLSDQAAGQLHQFRDLLADLDTRSATVGEKA